MTRAWVRNGRGKWHRQVHDIMAASAFVACRMIPVTVKERTTRQPRVGACLRCLAKGGRRG